MDPLEALLMPQEDEQMRALANSLRGRQVAADFFAGSTIPGIQRMAQAEQKYIQDTATRQGVLRNALESRKQDESQSKRYEQLQRDMQTAREADNEKDRQLRRDLADQSNALRETLAAMKGSKGEGGYKEPRTQRERQEFQEGAREAAAILDMQSTWEDDFAAVTPLTGGITNFLGRKFEGLFPDSWTDKSEWWSNYKDRVELVRRHELFGSALTGKEQSEWEKATVTPNDGPETIRRKLATQARIASKIAEHEAALAFKNGYDPEKIMMNYGDVVDVGALSQKIADGSYFEELDQRQASERERRSQTPEADPEFARKRRGFRQFIPFMDDEKDDGWSIEVVDE